MARAGFKALDANDDGEIDWDEFRGELGSAMEDGHAKLMFKLLDVDGNGVLETAEVRTAVRGTARGRRATPPRARASR